MKCDSLSASPDRAGRYVAKFSDGTVLRLYPQVVADFALAAGRELTEEEFARLRKAAGELSAKNRAVRIVAAADVSRRDLERRLVQKGEDPDQARQAVDWMEELNLVDDRETARRIAARCAAKGYGLGRARQALYEKQIPKQLWDEVLADYPDQTEALEDYLRANLPDDGDPKETQRVVNALLRRGHSYGDIRRALDSLSRGD